MEYNNIQENDVNETKMKNRPAPSALRSTAHPNTGVLLMPFPGFSTPGERTQTRAPNCTYNIYICTPSARPTCQE